ncbi:MAG: D-alanyl-D-alanine carboxypeptidase [Deltaproteobacteria bacterium]|nr:D-alanyl-D-alanine carboxypeptidase [Deltaproteobacteria bacterium]
MLAGRMRKMVLIITWLVVVSLWSPQIASAQELPHPFAVAVKSAALVDANSGQFLYGQNPDERISPASFAKLLTLFIVFDAIEQGQVVLEDKVWISKKAWRTGGSKMFVRQGDRVPLVDLVKGIAVVSGNDACVAVAEFIQGNEQAFVEKMNQKLRNLGLENSQFQTVNGLPAPDQYTTARDMALLALAYVQAHPEALQYHRMKEFTHENIRQKNRNRLLWRDDSVDGLKTGHTENAGYHLLTTAKREDQRFISVVMGAKNNSIRERDSLRLLNYGFRNFVSVQLFKKGDVLAQLSVWKGNEGRVELVTSETGVVTVPIVKQADVSWQAKVPERLFAPIERGQSLGQAVIGTKDEVFKTVDLVADRDIPRAGFFRETAHSAALIASDHGGTLALAVVLLLAAVFLVWYLRQRKPKRRRSARQ